MEKKGRVMFMCTGSGIFETTEVGLLKKKVEREKE